MNAREISGLLDQAVGRLDGYAEERIAAGTEEPAALGEAREYIEQAQEALLGLKMDDRRPGVSRALSDAIVAAGRVAAMADEGGVSSALGALGAAIAALGSAADDRTVIAAEERARLAAEPEPAEGGQLGQ